MSLGATAAPHRVSRLGSDPPSNLPRSLHFPTAHTFLSARYSLGGCSLAGWGEDVFPVCLEDVPMGPLVFLLKAPKYRHQLLHTCGTPRKPEASNNCQSFHHSGKLSLSRPGNPLRLSPDLQDRLDSALGSGTVILSWSRNRP